MASTKKITILDIAKHANVSASTVSRVLRGTTSVAIDKQEAVMAAVEELNYRPNIFAQSLASGQSMTIGVLTQNFGSPFYDAILNGILHGLEDTDYWPIFADARWQPAVEKRALQMLIDRRVDGLIIVGGQINEAKLEETAQKIPLINVGRKLETMPQNGLYVENKQGAYQAMRYLLSMGHRHIAHVTAPMGYVNSVKDVRWRYEGYVSALQDAGLQLDEQLVVEGNLLHQSGVMAVEMLMARGRSFSAVFAANDQMAFGVRTGLYRRGIRVPDDVSLIGFDDEPSAAYMIPPLTTVRQPGVEMGKAAAKAVLDLIDGQVVNVMPFKTELVVRESVARRR